MDSTKKEDKKYHQVRFIVYFTIWFLFYFTIREFVISIGFLTTNKTLQEIINLGTFICNFIGIIAVPFWVYHLIKLTNHLD